MRKTQEANKMSKFWIGYFILTSALMVVNAGRYLIHRNSNRIIPSDSKVAPGYVVPSKLEIKCRDIDGDNQKETILRVGGKDYLLRFDADSVPRVYKFRVDSARVIPENGYEYDSGGK